MFDSVTSEELEFIKAIESYRARTGKTFLSWSEVLTILSDLGYRRIPPKARGAEETERAPREVVTENAS